MKELIILIILATLAYGCKNSQFSTIKYRKAQYLSLNRYLEMMNSLHERSFYIDTSFNSEKIKNEIYHYLDQSLILRFDKKTKKRLRGSYDHLKVEAILNYFKDSQLYESKRLYESKSAFISSFYLKLWGDNYVSLRELGRIDNQLSRNYMRSRYSLNKHIENRVVNFNINPNYIRKIEFNKIPTINQFDKLGFLFFIAKIPRLPLFIVPENNRRRDSILGSRVEPKEYYSDGVYTHLSFLVAVPKIFEDANKGDFLPKLFLSKDMIDYEYQKIFLLEYLKKNIQDEEEAIKLFIYLQLIPTHILRPLNISPDITLTKKGNTYEWECSAGFKEYNYKIKGTLKGTTIKGELIFPEEVEEELKELKKLGFTIKEKGKRFTL